MKRDHRSNRLRYGGRLSPRGVWNRWATSSASAGLSTPARRHPGYVGLVGQETVEMGLPRKPRSRYRSLLVPLDGSPFAEHALPLALAIARRAGASVRLVHIHAPLASASAPRRLSYESELDIWLRQRQQDYLNSLLRRLTKVTSVPVEPLLMEGREVAASLCEVAQTAADLVVMATHGRGPLGRLWHGSVADVLMQRLTSPLLLVRGYDAPVDLTGDPVPRQVLIPLDGSASAERVLRPALDLGALAGAEHTLLRVLHLPLDYSLAYGCVDARGTVADRIQTEAWRYLRRLTKRLGEENAKVRARVFITEQSTAAAILWYAQQKDMDLITLATRGRGSLSRLFRGSVVDQLVRRADRPVLVVRTPEIEEAKGG